MFFRVVSRFPNLLKTPVISNSFDRGLTRGNTGQKRVRDGLDLVVHSLLGRELRESFDAQVREVF